MNIGGHSPRTLLPTTWFGTIHSRLHYFRGPRAVSGHFRGTKARFVRWLGIVSILSFSLYIWSFRQCGFHCPDGSMFSQMQHPDWQENGEFVHSGFTGEKKKISKGRSLVLSGREDWGSCATTQVAGRINAKQQQSVRWDERWTDYPRQSLTCAHSSMGPKYTAEQVHESPFKMIGRHHSISSLWSRLWHWLEQFHFKMVESSLCSLSLPIIPHLFQYASGPIWSNEGKWWLEAFKPRSTMNTVDIRFLAHVKCMNAYR